MDYFIDWNDLKERVYANQQEPFTMKDLRQIIEESWTQIPLKQIKKAITYGRKRLQWVVQEDSGPNYHLNP